MESDIGTFLEEAAENNKLRPDIHAEAVPLRDLWRGGVVPSYTAIDRLQKHVLTRTACGHLEWDGACLWVRRQGAAYGLFVPETGDRARRPFDGGGSR